MKVEKGKIIGFCSTVTVAELYAGARNEVEERDILDVFNLMEVVGVNFEVAKIAGIFRYLYGKKYGCEIPDAIIAATSFLKEIPLATRNIKHFNFIKGIKLSVV